MKTRIHKFLSRIKHTALDLLDKMKYLRFLNPCCRKNIYVIGTPNHTNVGDNAIAYAELMFLENCGIKRKHIKEIPVNEYKAYEKLIAKTLRGNKRLICMHGGGNMGNQWLNEEQFRRHVMEQLDINPMIILPQTFFYTDDEEGKSELKKSEPYYNERKNLTITAREKLSYELMRESYPDANVILTPDIVLSMDPEALKMNRSERRGVLFVMRSDGEKALTQADTETAVQAVENRNLQYSFTDMITALMPFVDKDKREEVILDKINQFAGAELVITDRLHAMVFAAISNTPCIVLKNNNHKITGTYEWISGLPYIKMADDVSRIEQYIGELEKIGQCSYDHLAYSNLYSDLAAAVKKYNR